MTNGPGPTNNQKTGRSLYAERIVPERTNVNANPNPLMSPAVQPSLIGLLIALQRRSALYLPLALGILRDLSDSCGKSPNFQPGASWIYLGRSLDVLHVAAACWRRLNSLFFDTRPRELAIRGQLKLSPKFLP